MNQRLQSYLEERKQIQAAFTSAEMPLSRYRILDVLYGTGSLRLRMTELRSLTGMTFSNLSAAVNFLEDEGLVSRIVRDVDRRAVYACITEKGRKAYEEADAIVSKLLTIPQA